MHEWEGTEAGRGHQLGISNRPPAFSWEYSVTSSCQLGTSHPPPCPAKHIALMPGFCQDHNPVVFPLPFLLTWVLPVPLLWLCWPWCPCPRDASTQLEPPPRPVLWHWPCVLVFAGVNFLSCGCYGLWTRAGSGVSNTGVFSSC